MLPSIEELKNSLGGRPQGINTKVRVSVYIDKTDDEDLRALCSTLNMPVSTLIRKLLEEYLSDKRIETLKV